MTLKFEGSNADVMSVRLRKEQQALDLLALLHVRDLDAYRGAYNTIALKVQHDIERDRFNEALRLIDPGMEPRQGVDIEERRALKIKDHDIFPDM